MSAAGGGAEAPPQPAPRRPIPLSRRRIDLLFLAFFGLNLVFVTYAIDLEQVVIDDPTAPFAYPAWPPPPVVDAVHWWGRSFDPALMARPPWWRATIWIDLLFFGPFYAVALHAFWRGREWIRIPSVVWASVMMTNVTIILFEEVAGPHASPALGVVLLANASWLLVPALLLARMARSPHPFTEPASAPRRPPGGAGSA